jgi:LacI family transcriptional regulator
MQGLLEGGVEIPGQLALVAYDNLPFRETTPVGMASIDVSIGRLYGTAVGLLAAILRGEIPAGEIRRQAVTPVLVNGPSLP